MLNGGMGGGWSVRHRALVIYSTNKHGTHYYTTYYHHQWHTHTHTYLSPHTHAIISTHTIIPSHAIISTHTMIVSTPLPQQRFPTVHQRIAEVTAAEDALQALLPTLAQQVGTLGLQYVTVTNQGEYMIELPVGASVPKVRWVLFYCVPCGCCFWCSSWATSSCCSSFFCCWVMGGCVLMLCVCCVIGG